MNKTTPKVEDISPPTDISEEYVLIRAIENSGTIIVNGSVSGKLYTFVGVNPVIVLSQDVPGLLALKNTHRPCCTGKVYIKEYFIKVE